ncbi:calcium-binding protein [Lysobacter enzymogenes]|uniref:calcium-binding protein n=1 Tax=Lysobacter enzymogenes TaxID=69 RepID=UPI0024183871|nr:calcium-binding protein [Lysobacter enzymogenes]
MDTMQDQAPGVPGQNHVRGTGGDDTVVGSQGDDILDAGAGSDTLEGGDGRDWLVGGIGADILVGGTGNDVLDGGYDTDGDTFRFEAGFGQDIIRNRRWKDPANGVEAIEFGAGISTADIQVARMGSALILTVAGTADSITIEDHFVTTMDYNFQIDEVRFADGTVWTAADLIERMPGPSEQRDIITLGDGDDAISALAGNDEVLAGDGNDTVLGGDGNDFVDGGAGDDTLAGGNGDDGLNGGAGNDHLQGGAGNDSLTDYDNGDDRLNGGTGNDYMQGGDGNDTYRFDKSFGSDTVYEWRHAGSQARNSVEFGVGIKPADIIVRRDGEGLTLSLAGASDTVRFQNYFIDTFDETFQIASVRFADGTVWNESDLLSRLPGASAGDDVLSGASGNDTIDGLDGDDLLLGQAGDDTLRGGNGGDVLWGGDGNDRLEGGAGGDVLRAGAGADLLIGGDGDDRMEGGYDDDSDAFRFGPRFGQSEIVNARSGTANSVDAIEFAAGIAAADVKAMRKGDSLVLTARATGDTITVHGQFGEGQAPSDGQRIDEVRFADGTVWSLTDLADMLQVASAQDDGLSLGDDDDVVDAMAGNDHVYAHGGDDIVLGGAGDDVLHGGSGYDNLAGGLGNDTLDGGDGNDTLLGGAGNDALQGGMGDDRLNGGAGNDVLSGYAGADIYRFDRGFGNDTIVDFNDGTFGMMDTIEFGTGIKAADIAVQRRDDALVFALAGSTDTVTIERFFTRHPNPDKQYGRVRFADGTTWYESELLARLPAPSAGDDLLYGAGGRDTIDALGGNDTVYGREGDDILRGGAGDDFLIGGEGNNQLDGGADNDRLEGGSGDDILNGGAGNDLLYGYAGKDTYRFDLGFGQDILYDQYILSDRDGETSTIEFGAGIAAADIEVRQAGNDLVLARVGSTDTVTVVEQFSRWNGGLQSGVYGVDTIRFGDGTVWNRADVYARLVAPGGNGELAGLIQTMADFGGTEPMPLHSQASFDSCALAIPLA